MRWRTAGTAAFVGRERELSRLQTALTDRVRLVLVVGDAGIGKTRFVAEGLRRATADGMLVVGGGCLPLATKPTLLPVADALGELNRLEGGAPFEAALAAAPPYVRPELARLLPRLAAGERVAAEPVEAWRCERLFAAVAELLDGVARRSQLGLLVEDVQWADTATLDFLTLLVRAGRSDAVSVVLTCRSDEVPLDAAVADWLTHARRDAGVEEIRLGPLSRDEVSEQVTALVGAAPPPRLVEEVYCRAEGHPFFTEQLVAAVSADPVGGPLHSVDVPARLADLLVARAARCKADARIVLNALAVAGRPLTEDLVGEVTALNRTTVRAAVRELTAARLLAVSRDEGHRVRHALLGEAVTAELLPGERASLHEQVARAFEAAGGRLAAEAAGHWGAAGRTGEELQARVTAARAAERVFAYADAAADWLRAIELCRAEPPADIARGIDVPHLYIQAVDALDACGESARAWAVAEEAYRQFADHPDPATAAVVHSRTAHWRAIDSPTAGLPLMKEALRLFEDTTPSTEQAWAWSLYANYLLLHAERAGPEEPLAALHQALEVAEQAGAATLIPRILCGLAHESFLREDIEGGFRLLTQAWSEPEASQDTCAMLWFAATESDALLNVGRLEAATRVALHGVDTARSVGLESSFSAALILGMAVEGLLGSGRTAKAAALIDPWTTGPAARGHWPLHACRAEIDLLRGDVEAAAQRLHRIESGTTLDFTREFGQRVVEVAAWAGRPSEALEEVQRLLEGQRDTHWVIFCGWLLAVGMRACADLAERGRARRDQPAVRAALAAADDLTSWVNRVGGVPFTEHPWVAIIPAARATWEAERGRATRQSDPAAWSVAAERWEALGYRHRAGYARWRQAEAILATPKSKGAAAAVLATAADRAVEHTPLTTAIRDLARRARIDLSARAEPIPQEEPATGKAFELTDRELDVLRLLGKGKTNPEMATVLFISPRTAGAHVANILRKLDATTRVQAATIAERAGLLASEPTRPRVT